LAQTSLGEKTSGTSQALGDCTRDEAASDSKSHCVAREQHSLVFRVSPIGALAAFAGEETTPPCVSATTVDVSSGRQPHCGVTMTKTLACISVIAFATILPTAFAQTADTPAPSPLHSNPAANPATNLRISPDPAAAPAKAKQGRRSHSGKPGNSSTAAPPSD